MNLVALKTRATALLDLSTSEEQSVAAASELLQGTLSIMTILYGDESPQATRLLKHVDLHAEGMPESASAVQGTRQECRGALKSIIADLDHNLVGNLQATLAGEILADLLALAKAALGEGGDGPKNVAAVLAAAAFEDSIRRLATLKGLPHEEKLADVLTALKDQQVIAGAQVSIAQSYLSFRNKALHAQWSDVDRPSIQAAIGFTEGILMAHFT